MKPKPEKIDISKIVIGEWADYFIYDPDGLAGPPTPKDEAFERAFFGDWVVDLMNENKEKK